MAKVSMGINLGTPAEKVWNLIGGFNALPNWHPAIEKSEIEGEGKGSIRTLHLVGGGQITERLDQQDEEGRTYSYTILSGPLPVANYSATIRLHEGEEGKGCRIEWESDFLPSGVSDNEAVNVIKNIYQTGFDNLRKLFGG